MKFSGAYGIILKTDDATAQKAEELGQQILPIGADYNVQKEAAHITLYHLQLDGLSKDRLQEILFQTRTQVRDINLTLENLEVMGGKFLFWDVKEREKLLKAHQAALELAEFLNREKVAKAKSEGLSLTPDQLDSLEKYGHPLVGEQLYRPHLTLGYDRKK